ncbi:MAG: hypothetical protein V1655_02760 [bacterium]
MKKISAFLFVLIMFFISACDYQPSSDSIQQAEQERILREGTAQLGMPNIKNFRQKRMLKDIKELCDQMDYITYLYIFSEYRCCYVYIGEGIGYPIPYATQYTNPQKIAQAPTRGYAIIPQSDPDALFYPSNAEGSWYMLKDPVSGQVKPHYSESRLSANPFKLPDRLLCKECLENNSTETPAIKSQVTPSASSRPRY